LCEPLGCCLLHQATCRPCDTGLPDPTLSCPSTFPSLALKLDTFLYRARRRWRQTPPSAEQFAPFAESGSRVLFFVLDAEATCPQRSICTCRLGLYEKISWSRVISAQLEGWYAAEASPSATSSAHVTRDKSLSLCYIDDEGRIDTSKWFATASKSSLSASSSVCTFGCCTIWCTLGSVCVHLHALEAVFIDERLGVLGEPNDVQELSHLLALFTLYNSTRGNAYVLAHAFA
jgi:hypothetical protein